MVDSPKRLGQRSGYFTLIIRDEVGIVTLVLSLSQSLVEGGERGSLQSSVLRGLKRSRKGSLRKTISEFENILCTVL